MPPEHKRCILIPSTFFSTSIEIIFKSLDDIKFLVGSSPFCSTVIELIFNSLDKYYLVFSLSFFVTVLEIPKALDDEDSLDGQVNLHVFSAKSNEKISIALRWKVRVNFVAKSTFVCGPSSLVSDSPKGEGARNRVLTSREISVKLHDFWAQSALKGTKTAILNHVSVFHWKINFSVPPNISGEIPWLDTESFHSCICFEFDYTPLQKNCVVTSLSLNAYQNKWQILPIFYGIHQMAIYGPLFLTFEKGRKFSLLMSFKKFSQNLF